MMEERTRIVSDEEFMARLRDKLSGPVLELIKGGKDKIEEERK